MTISGLKGSINILNIYSLHPYTRRILIYSSTIYSLHLIQGGYSSTPLIFTVYTLYKEDTHLLFYYLQFIPLYKTDTHLLLYYLQFTPLYKEDTHLLLYYLQFISLYKEDTHLLLYFLQFTPL